MTKLEMTLRIVLPILLTYLLNSFINMSFTSLLEGNEFDDAWGRSLYLFITISAILLTNLNCIIEGKFKLK